MLYGVVESRLLWNVPDIFVDFLIILYLYCYFPNHWCL